MGSTLLLLDESHEIRKTYRYDAFGNILEETGDTPNRLTYTGQIYDGAAVQYYLRARFYNPVIGRFMQEDTYRGDGLNLYAYCANNPVMYYDPSGNSLCPNGKTNPANDGGSEGGSKADFYVTPSGEAIPSIGYRYISENAPYLDDMTNSMSIPANADGTYFLFNNYNMANPGALQVPHDASVKVSFNTLQIIDDISVPYGNWGKASYFEPITTDFPQFGPGGATQVITHSPINIDNITRLPK